MKDLYFIDGYNVIFRDPAAFEARDLETARKDLNDFLLDFGAHRDIEIIVVYDGKSPSNTPQETKPTKFLTEVFTPKTMTADSYIEKESYRRRDEYRDIYVVSSDGSVQNQILGNGAYRMAVSEFMRVLAEDKKEQRESIRENNRANLRDEIGRNLSKEILEKLDALRK